MTDDRSERIWDREVRDDSAPGVVVAAVACGTVPTPLVAVYAVLFIVHGTVHPVVPPDITHSTGGELVAGLIALVVLIAQIISLIWATTGQRRWPFAGLQIVQLVATIAFAADSTVGGRGISILVALVSLIALVLVLLPPAWPFYGRAVPAVFGRLPGFPGRARAD